MYSSQTTGLPTAGKVNVLGTADMLWVINYYDNDGRNIKTYSQHYFGGGGALNKYNYDLVTTTYNFDGQPLIVTRQNYVKNAGGTAATLALTVTNSYTYDHMGRKTISYNQLRHQLLTSQATVAISKETYNDIGQVIKKGLHSLTPYTGFIQNIDYRYNERG
ncbi:hypothetical protein NAF17_08220 [Mucilaginibacter sp. RB4R14]|uniref:hypothetical protein n=1 Tax=Mucilaginibacter aurantiaciroseus TaxID=2949308 RepID=UPI0020908414|nr:hypothetical protein [Mucilaginibacter aurantiaciroseus]MCO5935524.1 hypothetical protein [Mucilaginibacter aurantiaciroseus]